MDDQTLYRAPYICHRTRFVRYQRAIYQMFSLKSSHWDPVGCLNDTIRWAIDRTAAESTKTDKFSWTFVVFQDPAISKHFGNWKPCLACISTLKHSAASCLSKRLWWVTQSKVERVFTALLVKPFNICRRFQLRCPPPPPDSSCAAWVWGGWMFAHICSRRRSTIFDSHLGSHRKWRECSRIFCCWALPTWNDGGFLQKAEAGGGGGGGRVKKNDSGLNGFWAENRHKGQTSSRAKWQKDGSGYLLASTSTFFVLAQERASLNFLPVSYSPFQPLHFWFSSSSQTRDNFTPRHACHSTRRESDNLPAADTISPVPHLSLGCWNTVATSSLHSTRLPFNFLRKSCVDRTHRRR